ncbi:MAG: hypothetical protein AAF517_11525 [Planctomycetota bacterium]
MKRDVVSRDYVGVPGEEAMFRWLAERSPLAYLRFAMVAALALSIAIVGSRGSFRDEWFEAFLSLVGTLFFLFPSADPNGAAALLPVRWTRRVAFCLAAFGFAGVLSSPGPLWPWLVR